jgi:SAM-dependent methyltransferase
MNEPTSHAAARELFDRTADVYQEHAEGARPDLTALVFARRKEVVLDLLDRSGASGTLLDFGMGPGVFARDAAERGFRFVGVDISRAMIERAEALGIPDATYVQGDLDALEPFRGEVDAVLAIGLIDYLEHPKEGLGRLVDCLRPGGVLLLSFRNRRSVNTALRNGAKAVWRRVFSRARWRSQSAFVSSAHEKAFTPAWLRAALTELGMDAFDVRYHNVTPLLFVNVPLPRRVWRAWRRLDRSVASYAPRVLCDAGVIAARKRA